VSFPEPHHCSYLVRHFERVSLHYYKCHICGKRVHLDGLRAHMNAKHWELVYRPEAERNTRGY
jgi:Fe-S-cluster-containing dehydrogenase component